jgi:hypothetical protein
MTRTAVRAPATAARSSLNLVAVSRDERQLVPGKVVEYVKVLLLVVAYDGQVPPDDATAMHMLLWPPSSISNT